MVNCSPACPRGTADKTKEWQMEMLMEKLRSKAGQYRSFFDCAKALRMALLEKRYTIDSVERSQLQKCLDTLQQNIKVTTHQAMVERLESVSRQLGLKFVVSPSGLDLFISTDMFFLEISLESGGGVKDVKVHHEGCSDHQPQSCQELVRCLTKRDFQDFTTQLEGLSSIYQLNTEKKIKSKAYIALTSLEVDLATLYSAHSGHTKDHHSIVNTSPIGYLEKRRGGHPMKLTYFVSPYELVDMKERRVKPLTLEPGAPVGNWVSVSLESSTAHKLQTVPLLTINRSTSGIVENWAAVTSTNRVTVAGCFVLRLGRPAVLCSALAQAIEAVTSTPLGELPPAQPLLSLVCQTAAAPHLVDPARGLPVNIGDQHHCYLMTESKSLSGVVVNSIALTHPSHVPQIIALLRQQALFNTVISSCVRPNTKQDLEKTVMFEVTPLSWRHVSVALEHPLEECMATVELDLSDISNLTCKVYTSSGDNGSDHSDYATKVFQRSLSIPVTMRSLIRLWNRQAEKITGFYNGIGGVGGAGGGGQDSGPDVDFDPEMKIKLEPGASLDGGFGKSGGFPCDDEEGEERRGHKRKRDWPSPKRFDEIDVVIESSSSGDSSPPAPPPALEFIPTSADLEMDKPLDPDESHQLIKSLKKKRREEKKAADILIDLGNKNLVPPSVSITPISSSQLTTPSYSVLSEMGLERRPGIEIIPLPSATTAPLPSSITITPIPSKSEQRKTEKKSSRSKSENKSKLEKKKKRKREGSPMGPPEKVPHKDPLTKPVSVSIKPAEALSPRPNSPAGVSRKYSSSPTHASPLSLSSVTGKSSPTLNKSVKASPKHSPAYSTNSPKNSLTSSPKHGTSSPKHQSVSGKPSLSTLKSAVTSPSKEKLKKDGKDRDKKSSGYSSPKSKSGCSKSKEGEGPSVQSGGSPTSSGDGGKSSASSAAQIKNRKSSLSAVIDKLKSAHQTEDKRDSKERASSSSSSSTSSSSSSSTNKVDGKGTPKPGEKSGEYSVKQSSDGMKLTINKTKSKESKRSSSDSPKSYTGVKTGTSSSSVSKKHPGQRSSLSSKSSTSSSKSLTKSSSSSSLKSIKPGSPKSSSSKLKINRDKSIFSSSKTDSRKMSLSLSLWEEDGYKALFPSNLSISPHLGDKEWNYQIPKLSARNNEDKKKDRVDSPKDKEKFSSSKNEDGRGGEKKFYPNMSPKVMASKLNVDLSDSPTISIIPVPSREDKSVEEMLNPLKLDLPISSISLTPVVQEKDEAKKKQEVADLLLDLTDGGKDPSPLPSSPSVSIHIVKSPATGGSPLLHSPHSSPTCIDDDDLMDEALVGVTK